MLDGSPVLDIKPYVVDFDSYPNATKGWLEHNVHKSHTMRLMIDFEVVKIKSKMYL